MDVGFGISNDKETRSKICASSDSWPSTVVGNI